MALPSAGPLICSAEDDIFFYTTDHALTKCPTYRKDLMRRFSEWLKAKYGTQEGLAKAWRGALKAGETPDAQSIAVQGNPWFMGDGLPQPPNDTRVRLLDNAAFLHEVQNKFYGKFVQTIRRTGYQGPLCGSPWQAPRRAVGQRPVERAADVVVERRRLPIVGEGDRLVEDAEVARIAAGGRDARAPELRCATIGTVPQVLLFQPQHLVAVGGRAEHQVHGRTLAGREPAGELEHRRAGLVARPSAGQPVASERGRIVQPPPAAKVVQVDLVGGRLPRDR